MMKNWKCLGTVLPAFAIAAWMMLGGAHVARATFLCAGPAMLKWNGTEWTACKGTGPNGVCQAGEGCDDGNTLNGDGCDNNCTVPACGNGVSDAGEECDNGPDNDNKNLNAASPNTGNACDTSCRLKSCGNGRVEGGEQCDDANPFNNDGCDSDPACPPSGAPSGCPDGICLTSACGNGISNFDPEACDDGNTVLGDGCDAGPGGNCTPTACGNGVVTSSGTACTTDADCPTGRGETCTGGKCGEQCDDGNTVRGDGCDTFADDGTTPVCKTPSCGNGVSDPGEVCDDGDSFNGDGCDTGTGGNCTPTACGNGVSTAGEECDDGNTVKGDGCDVLGNGAGTCQSEVCGDGQTNGTEQCDAGNCVCSAPKKASNNKECADDAGRTACTADGGTCVNSKDGSTCDPADANSGNFADVANSCRPGCVTHFCGDGITDADEVCDDGLHGANPGTADDTDSCPNGPAMKAMNMACQAANVCGDGNPDFSVTLPAGLTACDNGQGFAAKTCAKSGNPCSTSADCATDEACGNDDGPTGTCHTAGFVDASDAYAGAEPCVHHYCGDGTTDSGEGCDDNGTASDPAPPSGTDLCRGNCALGTCGDGVTDAGEECDAGAKNGMTGNNNCASPPCASCTSPNPPFTGGCKFNVCGDGQALDGEPCDDGNQIATDDCNACAVGTCGDNVTRTSGTPILEQCDDGNTIDSQGTNGPNNPDTCSADCCFESNIAGPGLTIDLMLGAQQCNLDHLAAEVAALPTSRAKKRLTHHMVTEFKLMSQASSGVAAGTTKGTKKACSAERRKERVQVCILRALGLGKVKGELTPGQFDAITQKSVNVFEWTERIRSTIGCL